MAQILQSISNLLHPQMNKIFFDRLFQIYQYRVSHKVLTLRSTISVEGGFEHTDIIFGGTCYIELPDYLENFVMYEGDNQERAYIQNRYSKNLLPATKIFVIEQGEKKYYVCAFSTVTKLVKNRKI